MNQNNNTCMPCILVYILMFRTVTVSCGVHVCRGLQILTYRLLPTSGVVGWERGGTPFPHFFQGRNAIPHYFAAFLAFLNTICYK